MGLCKCPKKKVTNLFCFEHRVNVCEHCLVANHPKCVVQSYLQWLQDSDYDPTCRLCGKHLSDEASGPCVRLQCYDVFHWSCLNDFARSLPPNTAPAGYACPTCHSGLFPANNIVSPVVDVLRDLLSSVNWARAGLGLPLIAEAESPAAPRANGTAHQLMSAGPPSVHSQTANSTPRPADGGGAAGNAYRPQLPQPNQSVISMDDSVPYSRAGVERTEYLNNLQKLSSEMPDCCDGHHHSPHDHDRDKYKRRPALQWFARWFSSRSSAGGRQQKDPNARVKRFFIILLLLLIGFVTLVLIFTRLGRSVTDDDPFLDPMANPNIRVKQEIAGAVGA